MEIKHTQQIDFSNPKLIGTKGKELWYPTYAPHVNLQTGKSILDEIYIKHPNLRHYR